MYSREQVLNISRLREKTGFGLMECAKALDQYDFDLDKAERWLQVKGLAVFHYRVDEKGNRIRVPKEI